MPPKSIKSTSGMTRKSTSRPLKAGEIVERNRSNNTKSIKSTSRIGTESIKRSISKTFGRSKTNPMQSTNRLLKMIGIEVDSPKNVYMELNEWLKKIPVPTSKANYHDTMKNIEDIKNVLNARNFPTELRSNLQPLIAKFLANYTSAFITLITPSIRARRIQRHARKRIQTLKSWINAQRSYLESIYKKAIYPEVLSILLYTNFSYKYNRRKDELDKVLINILENAPSSSGVPGYMYRGIFLNLEKNQKVKLQSVGMTSWTLIPSMAACIPLANALKQQERNKTKEMAIRICILKLKLDTDVGKLFVGDLSSLFSESVHIFSKYTPEGEVIVAPLNLQVINISESTIGNFTASKIKNDGTVTSLKGNEFIEGTLLTDAIPGLLDQPITIITVQKASNSVGTPNVMSNENLAKTKWIKIKSTKQW